jgi:hypothetical protein
MLGIWTHIDHRIKTTEDERDKAIEKAQKQGIDELLTDEQKQRKIDLTALFTSGEDISSDEIEELMSLDDINHVRNLAALRIKDSSQTSIDRLRGLTTELDFIIKDITQIVEENKLGNLDLFLLPSGIERKHFGKHNNRVHSYTIKGISEGILTGLTGLLKYDKDKVINIRERVVNLVREVSKTGPTFFETTANEIGKLIGVEPVEKTQFFVNKHDEDRAFHLILKTMLEAGITLDKNTVQENATALYKSGLFNDLIHPSQQESGTILDVIINKSQAKMREYKKAVAAVNGVVDFLVGQEAINSSKDRAYPQVIEDIDNWIKDRIAKRRHDKVFLKDLREKLNEDGSSFRQIENLAEIDESYILENDPDILRVFEGSYRHGLKRLEYGGNDLTLAQLAKVLGLAKES